jgi:hypothetical protein
MSYSRPIGVCIIISNLILEIIMSHYLSAFAFVRNKDPHYDGTGVYRWPPLHRPGITRTAHQQRDWSGPYHQLSLSTLTHLWPSPSTHHPSPSITISTPSLSTCSHHQLASTITHRHTAHPPSKIRISLHSDDSCCHSSQQGQILKPIETN